MLVKAIDGYINKNQIQRVIHVLKESWSGESDFK